MSGTLETPAVALSALSDDEVVKAAREAVASDYAYPEQQEIREGRHDSQPVVRAAILGARAAAALRTGPASDGFAAVREAREDAKGCLGTLRETIRERREREKPTSLHADDLAVDRFAIAMKAKLAKKRAEGRGGWEDKNQCTGAFLSTLLREHVDKGDPVDVANLAMMLHQRGERVEARTAPAEGVAVPAGWKLVPLPGAEVSADHPITVLNPEPTFHVHEVKVTGHYVHVRGENTCWFALPMISAAPPAADAGAGEADPICDLCNKPMRPGDRVVLDYMLGTVHEECNEDEPQPTAPDDLVPFAWFYRYRNANPSFTQEAEFIAGILASETRRQEYQITALYDATALQRLQSENDGLYRDCEAFDDRVLHLLAKLTDAEAKVARLEGAFQEHIVEREWPASSAPGMVDELSPREAWAVGATDALMFAEEDIRRALTPPAGAAQEMGGRNDG